MTINDRSFERQQREFTLAAGNTETWDVRLALREESATVIVSATTIPIEADKSPFPVAVISHEDISEDRNCGSRRSSGRPAEST